MTNKTEKTYKVELTEKELRDLFLSVHYVGEDNQMKEMELKFENEYQNFMDQLYNEMPDIESSEQLYEQKHDIEKETISLLNKLLNAYND